MSVLLLRRCSYGKGLTEIENELFSFTRASVMSMCVFVNLPMVATGVFRT